MGKVIVRILSFFAKELNSVRRQPLLLGGLILGPFLILTLFGLGYTGERPTLRTALVVPEGRKDDPLLKNLIERLGSTFKVDPANIYEDEKLAVEALNQDRVDLVEVFPAQITDVYTTGQAADIRFIYDQVDPLQRSWIEYLAYSQINELNKGMLYNLVGSSQQQAVTLRTYVDQARKQVADARNQLTSNNREQARASLRSLRENGAVQLFMLSLGQTGSAEQGQSSGNLSNIQRTLDQLDRDLAAGGALDQQEQQLAALDAQLAELDTVADRVQTIDPAVVVSPLRSATQNLAPVEKLGDINKDPSTTYVRFYTPGVLALLLQHMMVTLAGLSLVRERLQGTLEMFRVSPLSAVQLLLGKYLGYVAMAAIIMAVLTALLVYGLGVPLELSALPNFALMTLLVTLASLGWGFLISAVVSSDSQAVQLSMLILLMSVFFSGFFIALSSFLPFVQWVANLLPVTHGLRSFQNIMLLNRPPEASAYIWLSGLTVVLFLLSWLIFRRQFQRK